MRYPPASIQRRIAAIRSGEHNRTLSTSWMGFSVHDLIKAFAGTRISEWPYLPLALNPYASEARLLKAFDRTWQYRNVNGMMSTATYIRNVNEMITAATHRNASEAVLMKALLSRDSLLALIAVVHPNATTKLRIKALDLDIFDANLDSMIREYAAKSGDLASDKALIERVFTDEDPGMRRLIVRQDGASPELLARAIVDEDPWVREAAAENPNAPESVIEKAAFDLNKDVRLAAARNKMASRETLIATMLDAEDEVGRAAAENWKKRGFDQVPDTELPPPAISPETGGIRP